VRYEDVLRDLALADERLIAMTAENRAAIRGLPNVLGDRFLDTGITEQTLVGMAAGLALRGRVPVVHGLAAFLTQRAFEFIRTDVGIPGLPVKLVGYVPGVLSEANGPTHQAIEDVSLMRGIPTMRVFSPADADDLLIGLPEVLRDEHPFYIRFTDRQAPPHCRHDPTFSVGTAEVVNDGDDIGLLTHGALFPEAFAATRYLEAAGCSVRLVNLRTLKPIDEAQVLATARATRLLVTIEDHLQTGGLFSIVCELLVLAHLTTAILPIAFEHRWFRPALLPDLLAAEGLDGPQLAARIQAAWQRSRRS
jgi:transketolase